MIRMSMTYLKSTMLMRSRFLSQKRLPLLTLYTKDDCSLCEKALDELKPFQERFCLEKVDITKPENRKWFNKYCYDIPVFHLNGEFLMKHKTDLNVFIQRLSIAEQSKM